jgi:ribosome-interacting GTPase 1
MPANLPPQYYELEREYRAERDPREKLRLAEELLRMMPKHKGTDKLQADMKAKISKLKKQIGGEEKSHGARTASSHDYIPKEGAGQIIFIGPPNCGKSSLVDSFTNAKPVVADYPFSTREPQAGMMTFETIQLQLIDTPPISEEHYDNYLSNLIRIADIVILVADLADPQMADHIRTVLSKLEEKRILLRSQVEGEPEDPRFCFKKTL